MTATVDPGETTEHLQNWDRLRALSIDMVHGLHLLTENARAFKTAVELAHSMNAECVTSPEGERMDVVMLARLLDHMHNFDTYMSDDIAKATEYVELLTPEQFKPEAAK